MAQNKWGVPAVSPGSAVYFSYHFILWCVVGIWNDIEPLLVRLYSVPLSNEEKAFGIVKKKPSEGVLARNWLTFLMRQVISDVERLAHYATISVSKIKDKIQEKFSSEVHMGFFRSTQGNHLFSFEEVITHNSVLTQRHQNGDLYITPLFPALPIPWFLHILLFIFNYLLTLAHMQPLPL